MTAATRVPSSSGARLAKRCSKPNETQNCGKPWAKLVVPSSGSTYQRNSPSSRSRVPSSPFALPFFAVDSMLRKGRSEPLADQLLRGAVGHRNQVHIALVLGGDALGEKRAQYDSGLAGNCRGRGNPLPLRLCRLPAAHETAPFSTDPFASGLAALARCGACLPTSTMVRIWCL